MGGIIIKLEKQNINNLLELIKSNPNLEIVPMVDADIVADEGYQYWLGAWDKASIDDYYIDDERVWFKDDDFEELVDKWIDDNYELEEYKKMSDREFNKIAEEKVNSYNWVKVIVVYIKQL